MCAYSWAALSRSPSGYGCWPTCRAACTASTVWMAGWSAPWKLFVWSWKLLRTMSTNSRWKRHIAHHNTEDSMWLFLSQVIDNSCMSSIWSLLHMNNYCASFVLVHFYIVHFIPYILSCVVHESVLSHIIVEGKRISKHLHAPWQRR